MSDNIELLKDLDLSPATEAIRNAYHSQGYNGLFGEQAEFLFNKDESRVELFAPDYTRFMLYGRGPGKMPPKEAIESWMDRYGISGSPWPIMKHIAAEGTEGNNFVSQALPSIVQSVKLSVVNSVTKATLQYLLDAFKK